MKKEAMVLSLTLLLLILSCTPTEDIPAQKEAVPLEGQKESSTSNPQPKSNDIPAESKEGATAPQEIVETTKTPVGKQEEFDLIFPTLTYDGAYNGPLYGTSEQVGTTSMSSYFQNLDRNGISFFIGMFPIFGEPKIDSLVSHQGLGYVIDAVQKKPLRIIPFFNPGIGGEEVEKYLGGTLVEWYTKTLAASRTITGSSFIRGLGEVETHEWTVRHNDQKVLQLVDLAQANQINFMFHPVAEKIGDVKKMIEAYPQTIFLIHMYREDLAKSQNELIALLKEHDNFYFSIDAAHILHIDGDVIYEFDSADKNAAIKKFVSYYDSNEKVMINNAINAYKPLVDAVPEKVTWGTEIGPEYAFDPEVFDRAVKASRLVIAGFAADSQEAVAYRNALRVFGTGVQADTNIKVIDTSAWPECTADKISNCDENCGNAGDENLPDADDCLVKCTIELECREVPEMDVG